MITKLTSAPAASSTSGEYSLNGASAVFSEPVDWYTIKQVAGGVTLKDFHTGVTVTLKNILSLDFAGGTVLDAAGTSQSASNSGISLGTTAGGNTVVLGSGADSVRLSGSGNTVRLGTGIDYITLGSGGGTIQGTAATIRTSDHLNGGAGANTLAIAGGGSVNLAALAQFASIQTVALDATGTTLTLGSGAETVTATGGKNVVTLGSGADSISLGNGNDVVNAKAATLNAADHLAGGSGANTLAFTGGGTVNLAALAQFSNFQTVSLDATGTTLVLGSGAETVTATGGNNVVTLGSGADNLSLGNGNDVVKATAGNLNPGDSLNGGAGANTFSFSGGGTANLAALAQFANFQTIVLDATGTTLTLGSAPETVTAAGGNNVVTLGAGVDSVSLGNGNDIVNATAASLNAGDHLIGGAGANTLSFSGGGTVNLAGLAQFTNFQTVALDATGTTLKLGSAAETVTAAGGNNVVTLGSGVDSVSLGNGNDTVNATAASLNAGDHLIGGAGANTLAFTGGGTANLAALAQLTNFQTVALDATGTTLTLGNAAESVTAAGGNNAITLGSGLETVTLGAGNDIVYANGASLNASDHIDGGAGANTLILSGGGAVLAQFSNFETVMLEGSGTTLTVSSDPLITSTGGNNVITLGDFANTVSLAGGNNVITLGGGFDTVHMGGGNDIINLTAATLNAADTLDGGTGVNTLVVTGGGTVNLPGVAHIAGFQDITLDGSGTTLTLTNDPTTLTASGGNNVITLGNGLDTVTLGAGNDTVMVGAGAASGSAIDGGAGQNVAVFADAVTSYVIAPTVAGVDVTNDQTGAVVHLANIGSIDFAGGAVYDVATGQLSGGPAAPPPPPSSPGTITITPGTMTGTTGNDTFTLDVSTTPLTTITGDGGTDTVVMTYGDSNWYHITKNADGSVDISDVHATGHGAHLVGISDIDFAGNVQYDVASGTFSTLTSSSGGSSGTGSSGSGSTAPPPVTITITPGAMTGTTGNDTFTLDISTAPSTTITGDGGTDTVVMTYGDSNWYHITKNADGSVDVSEVHATGDSAHLVGIATIDFVGGVQYDVAGGTYSTVATSSGSGSSSSGSSGSGSTTTPPAITGVVTAPALPTPNAALGQVVAVELQNTTGASESGHDVSFGQVFADGDMAAGSQLVATVNGVQIAAQMDVKTTYADGSVKEAIVTLAEPTVAANGSVDVMLGHGTPMSSGPALTAQSILSNGYSEQVALTFHNSDGSTTLDNIDVGKLLSQAIASNSVQTWMSGPLATQVRVTAAINAQMNATFDITEKADGSFVTGVTIANDVAYAAPVTYTYDVTITDHGATAFSQNGVTQYSYSDWHQNISSPGSAALPFVVHDLTYLEKTGAIANYDTSLGVAGSEISSEASAVAASNTGILGSSLVTQYMPETGGRPDIGPTTAWATEALLSQDPTAAATMYAQTNVAGSVPWHFLDSATGEWVSPQNHPNFWADPRGTVANYGSDSLPSPYTPGGGWTMSNSHEPDLAYDAYLMTGSQYYLNELQAQASFDIASYNPAYRGGAGGIMSGEVRAMAWNLRDVAEAASATPTSDPLHAYFSTVVQNNLDSIQNTLNSETGQFKGYLADPYNNEVAPWQNDYMVVAMGEVAQLGYGEAKTILSEMDNFVTGLFLNGANGYSPSNGTGYWLTYTDANGAPLTTWSQLSNANFSAGSPSLIDSYADGYTAVAKAAIATLITQLGGQPHDIEAYAYLVSQSQGMMANYQTDPTWNITPVLPDGHHLLNSEIQYAASTGDVTLTSATTDSLLVAGGGNDTLQSGSGASILYGGAGSDTLLSYGGNDYLFACSGATTLSAGAGTNYLKAGSGTDTFVFNFTDAAHDTVAAFKAGTDALQIHTDGSGATAASLISSATTDAAGDAVLHLGAGHDVTLVGIHLNQLSTSWFHMM